MKPEQMRQILDCLEKGFEDIRQSIDMLGNATLAVHLAKDEDKKEETFQSSQYERIHEKWDDLLDLIDYIDIDDEGDRQTLCTKLIALMEVMTPEPFANSNH